MCIADDLAYVSCVFILILSLCFSSEAVYIYIYVYTCICHLPYLFVRTLDLIRLFSLLKQAFAKSIS